MIKKKHIIVMFILFIFNISATKAEANVLEDNTNVNIYFFEDNVNEPEHDISINDTPIPLPEIKVDPPSNKLPSTGELINSIIFLFLGFILLTIIMGVYIMKKIILHTDWRV